MIQLIHLRRVLTAAVAVLGFFSLLRLPIDAVPDISNKIVQITTVYPALSPAEVEKLHEKIAQMALSDGAAQDFAARFFAQTQAFTFDKQGRVGLSAELLGQAGITKEGRTRTAKPIEFLSRSRWTSSAT